MLTPKRSNQKRQAPLHSYMVNSHQPLTKIVLSQLVDHMRLQNLGAQSTVSLYKRIIGMMTGFTMDTCVNVVIEPPFTQGQGAVSLISNNGKQVFHQSSEEQR